MTAKAQISSAENMGLGLFKNIPFFQSQFNQFRVYIVQIKNRQFWAALSVFLKESAYLISWEGLFSFPSFRQLNTLTDFVRVY